MKKLWPLLLASFPLVLSAQQNFSIHGKIDQLKNNDKIFLIYGENDDQITDSAIVKDGVFEFKGSLQYPVYSLLSLHKNPYVYKMGRGEKLDYFKFYLEPAAIKMTAADSLKNIVISGSPANAQHDILKNMQKENEAAFTALNKEYEALPKEKQQDTAIFNSMVAREKKLMQESFLIHLAFAKKYPDSYLSVISLAHISSEPGMAEEAEKAYQALPNKWKQSPLGKSIPVRLASQFNTQQGRIAPDFEQQTADGKSVKLSGLRGKYLLLDFWASWCGPCREENPNLVKAYNTYHPKGFEILGVSLDSKQQREAWLTAIHKDSLTWTQVTDFKGWENEAARIYGIRSIPANFLLDPSGKIIAKNLRGDNLHKTLAELFK